MKIQTLIAKYQTVILLSLILLTAFSVRSYGRNWDEGAHMHPDERMLIMVADRISFPNELNPDFFNYGSLPIYMLRGTSQILDVLLRPTVPIAGYNGMLIVGRTLSSIFDVGTTLLIFLAAYLLTRRRTTALFASLLYSLAFFPIQNSHFFVVDVFLTFFITLLAVSFIWYAQSARPVALLMMGISMGAAVATKFSALIFMPGVVIALCVLFLTLRKHHKQWLRHIPPLLGRITVFGVTSLVIFAICMPFAFLPPSGIFTPRTTMTGMQPKTSISRVLDEYPGLNDVVHFLDPLHATQTRFLRDIREQTRMNSDAYVFPYTLQYVTTQPYIYYIEQIFKWGLGPFIGTLAIIGILFVILQLFNVLTKRKATVNTSRILIFCILIMYGLYFLIIGRSAVKFMRYMLPLYPVFALLAGAGLTLLCKKSLNRSRPFHLQTVYKAVVAVCVVGTLLWSVMFMNIYSQRNTRVAATEWILSHIPQGKTLAVEHWDDRIPIRYGEQYNYQEMTIYELPDDKRKWEALMQKLRQSDYVILASNRLYTPLPKLADCKKFKVCYPLATKYYQKLFDGSLGFRKIKEFTAYPRLGPWKIVDDSADESFTVYEHPKILIFKNAKATTTNSR